MASAVFMGGAIALAPAMAHPASVACASDSPAILRLRTRVEAFKGSARWEEVYFERTLKPSETAILICDMWDKHWCRGASERCEVLARKMVPLVERARACGIQIIHAPSDTMDFYKDYPQRRRTLELPRVEPPPVLGLSDPPLPIDDSDEGCDTPGDKPYKAWTRQNAAIPIAGDDAISDNGKEIYSLLRARGITTLLVMGVHTNMCVLNRSFAIKQMTNWGIRCVLVRDLTDTMYDPNDRPYVPHDQGTALVVEHIEKYWCPSILSSELLTALEP
ncbi:MAG: isochorismatase [Terriglobia bacterium]